MIYFINNQITQHVFWEYTLSLFSSLVLLERFRDFKALTCFSVCFSKTFPKGECVNLACSIICLQLEGNISSPVRYLYLSILPDNKADIFVASLLISHCSFHL